MPMVGEHQHNRQHEAEEEEEERLSGCGATPCCNPRSRVHRYIFLALLCMLNFGSYFVYDSPSALQDHIEEDMNVTTAKYSLLYSLYSWPNVILTLISGYIIDRWLGVRLGTIIFSTLVLLGQIIYTIGAFSNSFTTMAAGRFVFGLGGETLAVCQSIYSVLWFMGRELNFAFGISLTFSRLGSSMNMWVNPPLYSALQLAHPNAGGGTAGGHTVLGWTLAFGILMCIISEYTACQLAYTDRRQERILKKKIDASAATDVVQFRDLLHLPLGLWLMCIVCVGYYCAVIPFIGQANLFFQSKYDFSGATADQCTSIVFLMSAVGSPIMGLVIDRTGRNLSWIVLACMIGIASLMLLMFTFVTPFVFSVLYGISFSVFASAYWPAIAYLVPASMTGTAYGLVQAVQNLGFAIVAIVAGDIVDGSGYLVMLIFFTICICAATIATVVLFIIDVRWHGGVLNMPANTRQRHLEMLRKRKEIAARAVETEADEAVAHKLE